MRTLGTCGRQDLLLKTTFRANPPRHLWLEAGKGELALGLGVYPCRLQRGPPPINQSLRAYYG